MASTSIMQRVHTRMREGERKRAREREREPAGTRMREQAGRHNRESPKGRGAAAVGTRCRKVYWKAEKPARLLARGLSSSGP